MSRTKRQVRSQSREGRREATARSNRIKASTKLDDYPAFGRDYGQYKNTVCGFFTYTHLGIEVKLRYSQVSCEWTARAERLDIETTFPHQAPEMLQNELNDWLIDHIERPVSIDARLRMERPVVRDLAHRHGVSQSRALEIYKERGF